MTLRHRSTMSGALELEHSLRALPEHVAVRVILQQRLAEVLAEQDSRSRLHEANGRA